MGLGITALVLMQELSATFLVGGTGLQSSLH